MKACVRRNPIAARARAAPVGGFTLVEMLVVMLVMSIVALLTVPAFNAFSRSNTRTQAVEALKGALRSAREAARASSPGQDVCAVFVQGLGGRTSVVLARRVGLLMDQLAIAPTDRIRREVFVPVEGQPLAALPEGTSVRGYVGAGVLRDPAALDPDWYAPSVANQIYAQSQPAWVAPETHLYKHVYADGGLATDDDGADRNTFMLRFEGGTGDLSREVAPVLVVLPRPSATGRELSEPWASNRLDRLVDAQGRARTLTEIVDQIVNAQPALASGTYANHDAVVVDQRLLLGHGSSDTVLAGPVVRVALYDEVDLAAGLGVRTDRATGTIYWTGSGTDATTREADFYAPGTARGAIRPHLQTSALRLGNYTTAHAAIEGWLLGDTNLNGVFGDAEPSTTRPVIDTPSARVFMIERALGEPVEIPAPRQNVEGQ